MALDYPTMGICIAGIAAITPFLYRLTPEREKKPLLTEKDLDALDSRVNLYQRLATVESNQNHQRELLESLKVDFNSKADLLFEKLDNLLRRP